MKRTLFIVTLFALIILCQTSCEGGGSCSPPRNQEVGEIIDTLTPNIQYGFDFDHYDIHEGEVEKDWTLSHLFAKYDVTQAEINEMVQRNVDHLGLILTYTEPDVAGASDDKSSYTTAITTGNAYIAAN